MTVLDVRGVGFAYPGVPVLQDVGFSLNEGESLAITGPSGSGKSTLLSLCAALEKVPQGSIVLAGKDLAKLSEAELTRVRRDDVGIVFQAHHLLPQLDSLENVLVPLLADHRPTAAEVARARGLLDAVGLSHRAKHRPAELSGGEKQRVAVARALVRGPKMLVADEPTGALDRASAESLVELLIGLKSKGTALLVVTHAASVAQALGRVLELRDGRLVG